MRKIYKTLVIGLVGLFSLNQAQAYIDPGTGGVIAGSLWPAIVAFFTAVAAFLVKHFWMPIKKVILKIIRRK
jgi:hypothetical protein